MYIKATGKGERVFRDTHRDKRRQKKERAGCGVHTMQSLKNETGPLSFHCITLSITGFILHVFRSLQNC